MRSLKTKIPEDVSTSHLFIPPGVRDRVTSPTEVIKPKFGVFDTRASTTGRTKNVPIALFSAASRVAFDKGTLLCNLVHRRQHSKQII